MNVCPTGIDIRDGLQMGCIGCGFFIDACDDVMTRIDRPIRLIRFDVEGSDRARSTGQPSMRFFRPKSVLYGILCLVAPAGMALGVALMDSVVFDVEPQRNPPFVQLSDGSVRNDFSLRLAHRLPHLDRVRISTDGLPGATVRLATRTLGWTTRVRFTQLGELTGRLTLTVTNSGGSPPGGASMRATAERMTRFPQILPVEFVRQTGGDYVAELRVPLAGRWFVKVKVEQAGHSIHVIEEVDVLP